MVDSEWNTGLLKRSAVLHKRGLRKISDTANLSFVDSFKIVITGSRVIQYHGSPVTVYSINWWQPMPKPDGIDSTTYWLERIEEGGLYVYGFSRLGRDTVIDKCLDIKEPVNVGETWVREFCFFNDSLDTWEPFYDTMTCVKVNTDVPTSAGVFACNFYRYNMGGLECYSPGIGAVAIIDSAAAYKETLKRYTIH
jgi:hypothetical protein